MNDQKLIKALANASVKTDICVDSLIKYATNELKLEINAQILIFIAAIVKLGVDNNFDIARLFSAWSKLLNYDLTDEELAEITNLQKSVLEKVKEDMQ
jgi:DNA repair photolyase